MKTNTSTPLKANFGFEEHPDWEDSVAFTNALRPFLKFKYLEKDIKDELCHEFKISPSTLQRRVRKLRLRPVASSILNHKTGPTAGIGYISTCVEEICDEMIRKYYLSRQKHSIKSVHNKIINQCLKKNETPPSYATVRRRILALSTKKILKARMGSREYKSKNSPATKTYFAEYPMQIVQIDHTKVDVMIVDSENREPIGRPVVTVAIDLYTRMIVGLHFDLIGPACENVAETICSMAFPKDEVLKTLRVEHDWPYMGLPDLLHMDNGNDFISKAMKRGAGEHGIELYHRPLGRAHYGGHIERVIGTLMTKLHELPGTTFSNIRQKGTYDSQKHAVLTLDELKKFSFNFIAGTYHKTFHRSLGMSPLAKLDEAKKNGFTTRSPEKPADSFRADFMNQVVRSVRREGIEFERIFYWSEAIQSWYDNGVKTIKVISLESDITKLIVIGPDDCIHYVFSKDLRIPSIARSEYTIIRKKINKRNRHFHLSNAEIARQVTLEEQIINSAKRNTRKRNRQNERKTMTKLPNRPQKTVSNNNTPEKIETLTFQKRLLAVMLDEL